MRDQNEFMKQMLELVDLAKANEGKISKKEVNDFCSDLGLTSEQLKLVYAFLDEHHIEVSGYSSKKKEKKSGDFQMAEGDNPESGMSTEDSKYLHLYRRELRGLEELTHEAKEEWYERLLSGDENAVHPVIESHLKRVVTLAGKYKNRGVPLEDLIQEGNLALITTVGTLCGNDVVKNVKEELDRNIRKCMIDLADSHMESAGQENTILAKTNLIHEATKILAEEWGRLATVTELAEYTKMSEEEIRMYVDLSLETIHLGEGG
jgi:RNA polymerase primary sigma factor